MATAFRIEGAPTYKLMLTEEEAKVLRYILGDCIAGPDSGPRGTTSGVWLALVKAGVPNRCYAVRDSALAPIYFL